MPTPRVSRREPCQIGPLSIVAIAATLLLVAAGGHGAGSHATRLAAATWRGLVGDERPRVAVGERMLVLLKAPSLADRVTLAGGRASDVRERRWTREALAKQKEVIARIALQGMRIQPEFSYTRVLNGFSAALDPRAVALLERAPEVEGVYPVRAAYPASVSARLAGKAIRAPASGYRPEIVLPGFDGRGVTIALLDTGVDRAQPFLGGRVRKGFDVVDGDASAFAEPNPDDPTRLERHGTQMAGIVVGADEPSGLAGVATGAWVLPIRVAGWQRDATGAWSVYGRTDQLIAGLERAVDPNGDGDAHDAARVALVGLAEPYAAFADGPGARAVGGALRLDTLVVVPAGNDGPGGPGYGSISGPGGAPAALTVGAADLRRETEEVRVVLRAGLDVELSRVLPLAGAVAPDEPLSLEVAEVRPAPSAVQRPESDAAPVLSDFFDRNGFSLVAGRAALVPAGDSPVRAAENAVKAGAAAVLLYGSELPAGGIGLDDRLAVPVVGLPAGSARAVLAAISSGAEAAVSIGTPRTTRNEARGGTAGFSSHGLAFDGRVKPDLVGPGAGVATADPGANEDGSTRFVTVNGSSAAAAAVAGAAALLAQARPGLDAAALKSLLVGSARPLAGEPVTAQGAGLVDVGAAVAAELAVEPATLALGRAARPGWRTTRTLLLRNVSTRTLRLALQVARAAGPSTTVAFSVSPARLTLARGEEARVKLGARAARPPRGGPPAEGAILVAPAGGVALRVPWAITFRPAPAELLRDVQLSARSFPPSDTAPAVLAVQAGRVVSSAVGEEVQPVARLDIELWNARDKKMGLLARLRDLLPGRYAFGLTGRGPGGQILRRGSYRLRLVAVPTARGPVSRRSIWFTITK